MEKVIKVGLDIHGVIDAKPEFFSQFAKFLLKNNHEVHIITGAKISESLEKKLKNFGMEWTKLHSIVDFNEKEGADIKYSDPNNPWMDETTWNSTKAHICKINEIDIHFDDSEVYGEWFKTLQIETKYVFVDAAWLKIMELFSLSSLLESITSNL